ncbi:MAG: ABC transporter permease [Deltaproteobacteria bacterium]|nr:ABC transporter permease [Deltaproteobacteria bacterium]
MSYETLIGWRYVYRGHGSPRAKFGVLLGLALTVIGLTLFLLTDGASAIGVFALAGGMLTTVSCTLLYYLSVFTTVSVFGVILGVAALTVVLAVTTGFQQQFREKVLGVNAHVIIMKNTADFAEYRDVEKTAREADSEVRAVQPFIFVEMLVTRGKGELSGVAIKGIDPDRVTSVLDLHKHMVEGEVKALADRPTDDMPPPIILGQELARKLKAKLGDTLTVVAPLSNVDVTTWTSTGEAPKQREFQVSGIFYSGFDEYDRRLMYVHIKEAQDLLGQGDQVMGVELKVANVDRANEIADAIDAKLGGSPYVVQDWHELNRNLFTALTLQKIALVIILTIIIGVAAFNMVSALTMMVIDKTREVAILKSMGATSSGVARVFQVVGIAIGGVGTVFGLGIGLVLCKVVADYDYRLDPKVYLIDRLPISIQPLEIVLVGALTLFIAALATLVPSYRAAGLRPVEGLRHD